MGIRVVINLPFVSDDSSFLFAIRNGPFIPDLYPYQDTNNNAGGLAPNPKLPTEQLSIYAWNNMRNVHHFQTYDVSKMQGVDLPDAPNHFPKDYPIEITYFDKPPPLATFATSFRRWRGDMQYRMRVVAGFATQGYVFVSPIKNIFSPIGMYNPFKYRLSFNRQDTSYREAMLNSYVMGDTSMFRHIEVTTPYEYPVDWYDQFAWMARRVSPTTGRVGGNNARVCWSPVEPHGDNYIVMGCRGEIAAAHTGAQLAIELEYRAVEGFQFADPFLPNKEQHRPLSRTHDILDGKPITIPNLGQKCDGVSKFDDDTAPDNPFPTLSDKVANVLSEGIAGLMNPGVTARPQQQRSQAPPKVQQKHQRLNPRDLDFA